MSLINREDSFQLLNMAKCNNAIESREEREVYNMDMNFNSSEFGKLDRYVAYSIGTYLLGL